MQGFHEKIENQNKKFKQLEAAQQQALKKNLKKMEQRLHEDLEKTNVRIDDHKQKVRKVNEAVGSKLAALKQEQ